MDHKQLFCEWLKQEQAQASKKGLRSVFLYQKAVESMEAFEGDIPNAKTLRGIKFIGDSTFKKLVKKLVSHYEKQKIPVPELFVGVLKNNDRSISVLTAPVTSEKQQKRKQRVYIPGKRSGGYAILLALYTADQARNGLTQNELIKVATPFCDRSFKSNPGANQFYSAWSSVKQLEKHDLVKASGRPRRYYLTDDGLSLAYQLKGSEGIPTPQKPSMVEESYSDTPEERTIIDFEIWNPDEYDIVLVVDSREIRSKNDRDFFQQRLTALGVNCEVSALSVGDGIWIAKHKTNDKSVVLNFIFERKRIDDLAFSIRDGRFSEQKARLKMASIKHNYYLVEEFAGDLPLPGELIQTAISATLLSPSFHLRRFKTVEETIAFLSSLTSLIQKYYCEKKLMVLNPKSFKNLAQYGQLMGEFREKYESRDPHVECVYPFEAFMVMLSKSMVTVRELFLKMLMCTRGVSLEKAETIQRYFKTPRKLLQFFLDARSMDIDKQKTLLSELFKEQVGNKKIGPAVSQKLWETWG